LHSDHVGLVNLFADAGCKIYAGEVDGQLINERVTREYWDALEALIPLYGMEEDELITDENPGYKHRLKKTIAYIELEIGKYFNVGSYHFEIMDVGWRTA